MNVRQLTKEMLEELKVHFYCEFALDEGEDISYSEIADIDSLVSDEDVFDEYEDMDFGVDDFFCTAGQYDLEAKLEGKPFEYTVEVPVYLYVRAFSDDEALEEARKIIESGEWAFSDPEIIERAN